MEKKYQTFKHDKAKASIFRRLFEIQHELKQYENYDYLMEIKAIDKAIDRLFEKMLAPQNE